MRLREITSFVDSRSNDRATRSAGWDIDWFVSARVGDTSGAPLPENIKSNPESSAHASLMKHTKQKRPFMTMQGLEQTLP